jgi:hypothetical protein
MPANDALSVYQVGVQSAFGTNVAATAKLAVPRIEFDETGARAVPPIARGLMIRNRGYETVTAFATAVSIPEAPVYYEQLQTYFNSFIKGGVTGTGGGAPYTWTFARSLTADPALKYLTLERRVKDFSTNEDVEVGDVVFNQMTFRYAERELLRFTAQGFGRKNDDTSTLTAGQSLPTPEFAASALSKVYIDDAWASLGGTQITTQVIGFEWSMHNGAMPYWTADARANLDYSVLVHNAEQMSMELRLTCLMDPTRYATEKAKAQSQGLRAVRLQVSGTSSRDLKIDGLYKYAKPDILMLGSQDGQVIVVLELEEATDGTNFMQAIVVNATSEPDGV